MEEILKELKEIKVQQLAANNLIITNGKQNAMVLSVLENLLQELQQEQGKEGLKEIIEEILNRFEIIVEKLGVFTNIEIN